MSEIKCNYSPFCAEEGCELIAHPQNQANQSGAKTPEQARSTGRAENGKYWTRSSWQIAVSNTINRATRLRCAQKEKLERLARSLTQKKTSQGELI